MTRFLDGTLAKLDRAAESIIDLEREITNFLEVVSNQYVVLCEFSDDGLEYSFIVKGDISVPSRFSVLTGEIIHHIRSSLDHLIAALVINNGFAPTRKNTFPISTRNNDFEKSIKRGCLENVPEEAKIFIRQQQPYHNPNPEDHFLVALRDFNNWDKHRLLIIVTTAAVMDKNIEIGTDDEIAMRLNISPGRTIVDFRMLGRKKITNDGEKVFSVFLKNPDPTFTASGKVIVHVVFEECGLVKLVPVIPILKGLHDATRRLVENFHSQFI